MKKIVIIGPESTGKSSLCEQLAEHFKTLWVPEYAREYLTTNGTAYTYGDLLKIAKGQIKSEERIAVALLQTSNLKPQTSNLKPLFIDTDLYVIKVWSEFVFGKCNNMILTQIANREYDLYLLCNIDLPWIADELREYPDYETRKKLYCFYRDLLINQNTKWVEISGNYEQRLQSAIKEINEFTV